MESTLDARIREIAAAKGLTVNGFGQAVGIGASTAHYIANGRSNPSYDILAKIAVAFPDINLDWLLLGKGTMFRPQPNMVPLHIEDEQSWDILKRQEEQLELQRANYRAIMQMLEEQRDREKQLMARILDLQAKNEEAALEALRHSTQP